jgi:hypothetical protein
MEDSGITKTKGKVCKAEEFEYVAAFPFCPGCCGDWRELPSAYDEDEEERREREEERVREAGVREWMMFWSGL